jgi:hypothetical protein
MTTLQDRVQPLATAPRLSACWECGAQCAHAIRVQLFTAASSNPLVLCRDCYRTFYVPLTLELTSQVKATSPAAS